MKRSAGILLSISSLPSRYGIGCFDESAYRFVDWLAAAGQTYWQILPLGPTSYGDSPYQSFSTFAGNPYFISLDEFVKEGLLTEEDCKSADAEVSPRRVDYRKLYQNRWPLLKMAYGNSRIAEEEEFAAFCEENEWLSDYALFMALKDQYKGAAWSEWDEALRLRREDALEQARQALADEIGFYKFLQYHFYRQWEKLKAYANEKGIQIIGDIPIYVALDSADTWASPQLFQLDENNVPKAVAGCPPDGFAADGQLWGNPLYDWEKHKATGYQWWISRLAHCFKLYDVVRIDHFRGFDAYYSIPYGDENARNGHWEKGPGMELFRKAEKVLGRKDVIAEDLGFMTDTVRQLVKDSGFPNMKVLEFAFDSRDTGSRNDYLPHNYDENCIAYTGTHDNQTITSWFETITEEEQAMARAYLCDHHTPDQELYKGFIALIMRSKANVCIIPMQDWLGLNDDSRMNKPSTVGTNWKWRMKPEEMSRALCEEIRQNTQIYGR
ncbi:MAG: 4-alpha-glucanotransferase [Ruminococcus sp.]|nr:4-alpha-glucanotransferase [Ruminococcus sp.]